MNRHFSYLVGFLAVLVLPGLFSCKKKEEAIITQDIKVLTPSSDSRLIYVSQDGDDATGTVVEAINISDPYNPGISINPYKSLSKAVEALRDGYPDWILMKRGDVWTNESFGLFYKSGREANEPIVITYYGTEGERPLIKTGREDGMNTNGRVTSNIVIAGIDLYAHTRDPHSSEYEASGEGGSGFRFVGGGDNITIDDCVIRFFKVNIIVQSYETNTYSNFSLRRTMVLNSYFYPDMGHSQGMFIAGVDGILIEDNLFDHNGWNKDIPEAEATKFNHNMYIQWDNVGNNIVVKNNISARASSHGIMGRPGGIYEDNLSLENSISLSFGYHDHPWKAGDFAIARNNVLFGGKLMDPDDIYSLDTKAVWGLDFDSDIGNQHANIDVERNVVAHAKHFGPSNMSITQRDDVNYSGNIIYKWTETEEMENPGWSNPELSIGTYMESLGLTSTLEAFLDQCRSRKLNQWNLQFTAPVVNNYIRAGFDM